MAEKKLIFDIDQLQFLELNARKHSEKNILDIMSSLKDHGQQTPIVVDKNKVVRKGNGTLMAAIKLGWDKVWVTPYSEAFNLKGKETEVALKKYALQDNRSGETSEWNLDILQADFKWLMDANVDLADIGWEPFEYEPIVTADFKPPTDTKLDEGSGESSLTAEDELAEPIVCTKGQRQVFERAVLKIQAETDQTDMKEGRALELISAEFVG